MLTLLLIAAHMPRDDKAEENDQIGQGEANGNANVLTDTHTNKYMNKYSEIQTCMTYN